MIRSSTVFVLGSLTSSADLDGFVSDDKSSVFAVDNDVFSSSGATEHRSGICVLFSYSLPHRQLSVYS